MAESIRVSGSSASRSSPSAPAESPRRLVSILPLILLVYSTLIPQEVRFEFADQTIYAPRMVEIVLLPWLLHRIASGKFPLRWVDRVFVIVAAWMVTSFYSYYASADSLFRSVPLAMDTLIPYLVARHCIRDAGDLRRLLVLAAPGFFLAGFVMALESTLHVIFLRPFFAKMLGELSIYQDGIAVGTGSVRVMFRLGLLRSGGPFSHPILAGVYLSSLVPMYFWSGLRGWPGLLGLAAGGCFVFSVSSGAFLALLLGIGIPLYDRVQSRVQFLNWTQALVGLLALLFFLQVASNSGAISVLTRLTLDPATASYRMLIWDYGMQSVWQNPWFGIGLTDFERASWMPTTVDAHWLLLAIRHGLIVPTLMLVVFLGATIRLLRQSRQVGGGQDRQLSVAVAGSLFGMIVSGFTVTYFGGAMPWLYVMVGIAISLGVRLTPLPEPVPAQNPARFQRA